MKFLVLLISLLVLGDLNAADELQGCNTTIVAGLKKSNFYSSANAKLGNLNKYSMGGYASEPYLELYLGKASVVASNVNTYKSGKTNYDYVKIKNAIRDRNNSININTAYDDLEALYLKSSTNRLSELALMKLATDYDCNNTTCELQDWINGVGQEAKSFYEKVDKMYIKGRVKFRVEGYDDIYCVISAKDLIKAFTGVVIKYEPSVISEVTKLRNGNYGNSYGSKLRDLPNLKEAEVEKYATKRVYNSDDSKIYLLDGTEIKLPIKFEVPFDGYKVIEKETGRINLIFDVENHGEKKDFKEKTKILQYGCMFLFRTKYKDRDDLTKPWQWKIELVTIPLTGAEYLDKTKTCTDFISKIGDYTPGSIPSIRYYVRPMKDIDNASVITSANTQLCRKK
jgi:hypothetical protein